MTGSLTPAMPTNPCYSTYRNKTDHLSAFLSGHNLRVSSARTVNRLAANEQARIIKQALMAPRNERKLRKLALQNPVPVISELVDSVLDSAISLPQLHSNTQGKTVGSLISLTSNPFTEWHSGPLMSIDLNSKFGLTRDDLSPLESEDKVEGTQLLLRHNNCVHFVPSGSSPTSVRVTVDDSGNASSSSTQQLPMFYVSATATCSGGLSGHGRLLQITFE